MERARTIFASLFGFNTSLFLYFLVTMSSDAILHIMIFTSGVFTVLLFTLSKTIFEDRTLFVATVIILVTTFVSSIYVPFGGNIFRWLIVVIYNIAQTRTMRLVDVTKTARRNIIMNTVMLALNIAYEVVA